MDTLPPPVNEGHLDTVMKAIGLGLPILGGLALGAVIGLVTGLLTGLIPFEC